MSRVESMKFHPIFGPFTNRSLTGLLLICGFLCPSASSQGGNSRQNGGQDPSLTLFVSVRDANGSPLPQQAIVYLSKDVGGQNAVEMTKNGATAVFQNVKTGNYEIDVEAAGYKRAHERAEVGGDSSTVYVYMRPEGTPDPTTPVYPQPALSPKLQKEIERGIAAIHGKNYAEARQHLLKANK